MELLNATRMAAAYNVGLEPSGRELLVVVIKGTFRIPQPGEPPERFALHEQQMPLVMADTFTGTPGLSATAYEADFAPRKTSCDILCNGSAYAPNGRPVARVEAGIRVGGWKKRLVVIGARHWDCRFGTMRVTSPQPFEKQPISYDVAFGGTDLKHKDPAQHAAFTPQPGGEGLPQTSEA